MSLKQKTIQSYDSVSNNYMYFKKDSTRLFILHKNQKFFNIFVTVRLVVFYAM